MTPAEAEVACSDGIHRVRWERGRLVLVDHDDVEAERALRALGAPPTRCLVLDRRWQHHADDVALITLGRRPGEATIGCAPDEFPDETSSRRSELLALMGLPAPMIDRLVLTAAAAAADRWSDDGFREAHGLRLGAALKARATPALRRLGEQLAPGAEVTVECRPTRPGESPAITAERHLPDNEVQVDAALPLAWVASVWGAGISEPAPGGTVVLAVAGHDDADLAVDVARWQPTAPDRWEVVPERAVLRWTEDTHWSF